MGASIAFIVLAYLLIISVIWGAHWRWEHWMQMRRYRYTEHKKGLPNDGGSIFRIWIDDRFGANDRIEISRAIGHWNAALNGKLIIVEGEDAHWRIWKTNKWEVVHKNTVYKKWEQGKSVDILGFVDMVGGANMYLIMDKINEGWLFGIVLHEIGHLLGLEHLRTGLMHKTFSIRRASGIDIGAMEEIGRIWGWETDELNWMERNEQ